MGTLEELQSYIITNATGSFKRPSSTGAQTPIFLGQIPASQPDRCVGLFETGGLGPVQSMNSTAIYQDRPSVQVMNRAGSYTAARADAQLIKNILNGIVNKSLSGTVYTSVNPIQSPFDLPQDTQDRQVFSCNYTVNKENS